MPETKRNEMTIAFTGNPNCGKTTLFNAYTGANLKVANWPGVTVEKVEGVLKDHDLTIHLVDLPGLYSLTSYTMEEKIAREFILSDEVDLIINVADASSLEHSLYLTLQLLELGKPVVMALNMMDIVEKRGMEIDLHRLPEMLGIPVIPVSARKRRGLEVLLHAAAHHKDLEDPECAAKRQEDACSQLRQTPARGRRRAAAFGRHAGYGGQAGHAGCAGHAGHAGPPASDERPHAQAAGPRRSQRDLPQDREGRVRPFPVVYSEGIEKKICAVSAELKRLYPGLHNYRWLAIKDLEADPVIQDKYPLELPEVLDRSYESDIINEKYDFISEIIDEVLVNKNKQDEFTNALDRVLTHRIWGIPIFLAIMAVIFFFTFTVGDWLKGYLEDGIDWVTRAAEQGFAAGNVNPLIVSLVTDGIIGGVGTILTFLPNILILFVLLALLEDSGYMARVAYVMEGIMSKMGLSGKAFIPMLLGFGCTVPAIMASRALENRRDRLKVMLVTPFMSCNAKLTIYILFSEMFFPDYAMLAAYSMYVIGILVAILVSWIVHLIDRKESVNYLMIELPEYKMPDPRTVAIYTWEKIKQYLIKAGTTIFIASIVLWLLLNFGSSGYTPDMTQSFAAGIGKALVPVFVPVGLGFWQITVALIAGISAKEVVVSSCAILFGISNASSPAGMEAFHQALTGIGFGPFNAY